MNKKAIVPLLALGVFSILAVQTPTQVYAASDNAVKLAALNAEFCE